MVSQQARADLKDHSTSMISAVNYPSASNIFIADNTKVIAPPSIYIPAESYLSGEKNAFAEIEKRRMQLTSSRKASASFINKQCTAQVKAVGALNRSHSSGKINGFLSSDRRRGSDLRSFSGAVLGSQFKKCCQVCEAVNDHTKGRIESYRDRRRNSTSGSQ